MAIEVTIVEVVVVVVEVADCGRSQRSSQCCKVTDHVEEVEVLLVDVIEVQLEEQAHKVEVDVDQITFVPECIQVRKADEVRL